MTVDFAADSHRRQQSAARLSLGANVFLVAVKISVGLLSGSISVLAEGVQSTVDVASSLLILVTLRAAAAPPDDRHPYGHGKFENVAALAQMMLVLGSVVYLLAAAWERWQHPVMPRVDLGIAALAVAVVVNAIVSTRVGRVARETGSVALAAEATHLRGDLIACVGVLLGLVAVGVTGEARLDPAIAGAMTLLVVYTALRQLWETLRPLMDESLPVPEQAAVLKVLDGDTRVLGYHRLRTRRAGAERFVDIHVLLEDELPLVVAHRIGEDVEAALRSVLPNANVMVHLEPYRDELAHQEEEHPGAVFPGDKLGR